MLMGFKGIGAEFAMALWSEGLGKPGRITLGSDFGSETNGENDGTNPLDLITPM
jgi:hypothetical protein